MTTANHAKKLNARLEKAKNAKASKEKEEAEHLKKGEQKGSAFTPPSVKVGTMAWVVMRKGWVDLVCECAMGRPVEPFSSRCWKYVGVQA